MDEEREKRLEEFERVAAYISGENEEDVIPASLGAAWDSEIGWRDELCRTLFLGWIGATSEFFERVGNHPLFSVTMRDMNCFRIFRPDDFEAYLLNRGWEQVGFVSGSDLVYRWNGEIDLKIPADVSFVDYPSKIAEVFSVLQFVEEQRSVIEIMRDVLRDGTRLEQQTRGLSCAIGGDSGDE